MVGTRFRKVRVATGPQLHYAESGQGNGDPLLFLHGWTDSWFTFSRVLPLLPTDVRALAFDQRGYGESDRPDSTYSIPELAADVAAFLDALEIERATLVGHSFGSFVARQAAIANPDRFNALVLIGTGFAATNPVLQDLQKSLRDLPDPIPESFAREFQASTAYRPLPPDFFERLIVESLKLPPHLWKLLIDQLRNYDDASDLVRIQAPTLLLWGDRDALFSRAEQDGFLSALPAAHLKVYEETGHCPNWERPDDVAADIEAFCGEYSISR